MTAYFVEWRFRIGGQPPWRTERLAAGDAEVLLIEHQQVRLPGGVIESPACTVVATKRGEPSDLLAASARLLARQPFEVLRKVPASEERMLGLRDVEALCLEGRSRPEKSPRTEEVLALHALLPRGEVAVTCAASTAAYPRVAADMRALLRTFQTY